jgi:hypothetical protein
MDSRPRRGHPIGDRVGDLAAAGRQQLPETCRSGQPREARRGRGGGRSPDGGIRSARFPLRGYSAGDVVRFVKRAYSRNGGGKSPPGAVMDAVRAITHPGLDGVLV